MVKVTYKKRKDGLLLGTRVVTVPKTSLEQNLLPSYITMFFLHLGEYSTVFQAEVFATAEAAKTLIMERIGNEKILTLVKSQAAILAIQNNIVKSYSAVLTCIKT